MFVFVEKIIVLLQLCLACYATRHAAIFDYEPVQGEYQPLEASFGVVFMPMKHISLSNSAWNLRIRAPLGRVCDAINESLKMNIINQATKDSLLSANSSCINFYTILESTRSLRLKKRQAENDITLLYGTLPSIFTREWQDSLNTTSEKQVIVTEGGLPNQLARDVRAMELIMISASQLRLHHSLLSPTVLKEELIKIKDKLPTGIELVFSPDDIYRYYTEPFVSTLTSTDGFDFILKIPLQETVNSPFKLYRAYTLPIKRRTTNNKTVIFQLKNVPPYLAVSKDGKSFVELEHVDLTQCININHISSHCPLMKGIQRMRIPTCSAALFSGQRKYNNLCYPTFSKTSRQRTIAQRVENTNLWLVSIVNGTYIQTECLGYDDITPPKRYPMDNEYVVNIFSIHVPNECRISDSRLELPTYYQDYSNTLWKSTAVE